QALRHCHFYICVSQSTKNDLLKVFPQINPHQTSVIYEAAENKYDKFLKLKTQDQEKKKASILKQYGLNHYILAQGTREPRKNLDRLITAFNQFKNRNPGSTVVLAIAGKYGWGEDVNNPNPGIKILGYIPEKDMVALHASALCLAYPSLYEGFGLPIIKSMKVGVPVITSNTSSMAEISGNAAILVDPKSIKDISNALEKIIKHSSTRKSLSQKSVKQSHKFSWTQTAQQTLKVYQSL
ncbi:MAG: glycosyltransferase family 4 protein, partial [Patescibacteria group bacterium]